MTNLSVARLAAVVVLAACNTSSGATMHDGASARTILGLASADSLSVRLDHSRILGDSTAKVWMIMVSDFQCPYCKQWHDESFAALRHEYVESGKIRLAFYNFPLSMHPNAVPAAEAAMCAGAQGKFWPMHDALFAAQATWAPRPNPSAVFDSLATAIGLDPRAFEKCRAEHASLPMINADQDRASRAGVQSTPTIIIGNKLFAGAQPTENYRRAIDAALATK
jgi:protein-disulfide isomerase